MSIFDRPDGEPGPLREHLAQLQKIVEDSSCVVDSNNDQYFFAACSGVIGAVSVLLSAVVAKVFILSISLAGKGHGKEAGQARRDSAEPFFQIERAALHTATARSLIPAQCSVLP